VFDTLARIIQRKWVTVLLRGESGTGKEMIAHAIHYNSSAPTQPFVEINCSAIPEALLEAELFGYEKGAFTDAKTRKRGLFELAENGSLFLDEIGEVSPQMQVKLLKAVEEKKIRRLGGTEDIQINTRIITATSRDLQAAIRDGQFRQELYYRLNVVSIYLPPLRERGDDILLLAHHFLCHFAKEYASTLSAFTAEAEALLREYHWPGNIRELRHTIERVVLLSEGQFVTRTALARAMESETPALPSKSADATAIKIDIPPDGISFEEIEKQALQAVLEKMGWNKRLTSRVFKISRPRLARKIEKYQLKPSEVTGNDS
ncbi:MAG: sigma-54 interaction domain-containing protein, partial [bacterium]